MPPRRRLWPLLVLLAVAVGGVLVIRSMRRPAVAVTPDAAVQLDAAEAPPIDTPPPPDAPVDATPIDAPRPDARRIAVRTDAAPTGPLKSFVIGAVPWAYFTIDNDPKQYETPQTLKLSVGTHRVTFTNPELDVSRTVTITVPPNDDGRHVEKMN